MTGRINKYLFMLIAFSFIFNSPADAQYLQKRSQVGFSIGHWNQKSNNQILYNNVETNVSTGDLSLAFYYAYSMEENLSFSVTGSVLASEIKSSSGYLGVSNCVENVVSLMIGLKYYPGLRHSDSQFRPYLAAATGPYIASIERNQTFPGVITEPKTLAAFGISLGGGIDIVMNRRVMMGTGIFYYLVDDFSEPVGGLKNYSGFELKISFGFLFGKGVKSQM